MIDAKELKTRLPLPELMVRCGDGDRAKKSALCPFHEDGRNSFSVFQRDGLWFWKCHAGCGEGDEVHYLQKKFNVDTAVAFEKWRELAGVNGQHANKPAVEPSPKPKADNPPKPEQDLTAEWKQCVAAFTDEHVERLAKWRGLSVDFCHWLKERELVGLHSGLVALPVHGDDSTVTALHIRTKDGGKWFYEPSGATVRPFALGDPPKAENFAAYESQWDMFAVADVLGWHKMKDGLPGWCFFATRGAGNAKLARPLVRYGATVYSFAQNDEPGQKWLQDLADVLRRPVKTVVTPAPHKDVADWHKGGATLADLNAAIEDAQTIEPSNRGGLETVSAAELLAADYTQRVDIIEGILPVASRLIMSAPSKLGKTLLTTQLALGLVTGKDVLGFHIKQAVRLLYFNAEVSPENLQKRLHKLLAAFPVAEDVLRERLRFYNRPLKLTNPEHVQQIREEVEYFQPSVVVFDPKYKFDTGSEDKVQDATRFFDPLDNIIADYRVSVVLVHHHGKGSGEGLATPAYRNRGSSSIADWPDSLLTVTFEDASEGIVKMAFTLRNAEEPPPMAFQRDPDTLWFKLLEDYGFTTKGSAVKITPEDVAATIGSKREIQYGKLADELATRKGVTTRTAKTAIQRAIETGTVTKNLHGLYEVVKQ